MIIKIDTVTCSSQLEDGIQNIERVYTIEPIFISSYLQTSVINSYGAETTFAPTKRMTCCQPVICDIGTVFNPVTVMQLTHTNITG
jgi:hypothetical protein